MIEVMKYHKEDPFTESRKEGPVYGRIPYGLGFLMILQVAKRIANVHFDPLSSFLMNTGGSLPLFKIVFISL